MVVGQELGKNNQISRLSFAVTKIEKKCLKQHYKNSNVCTTYFWNSWIIHVKISFTSKIADAQATNKNFLEILKHFQEAIWQHGHECFWGSWLSVFNHYAGLALKRLNIRYRHCCKCCDTHQVTRSSNTIGVQLQMTQYIFRFWYMKWIDELW